MQEKISPNFVKFFDQISGWRDAYHYVRLAFLGIRQDNKLSLIRARIFLDSRDNEPIKPHFIAQSLEAAQWIVPKDFRIEDVAMSLLNNGLDIDGIGRVMLPSSEQESLYISPPQLLHPDGIINNSRISVLTIQGSSWKQNVPQPDSDWILRAADTPYDNIQELCTEYDLGPLQNDRTILEVVARTVIAVSADSKIEETSAKLGIIMSDRLEESKAKMGIRILSMNKTERRTIIGRDLRWSTNDGAKKGFTNIEVPPAAVVQCFASYDGQAHHSSWYADPKFFQNPRMAPLREIDPDGEITRSYLEPSTANNKGSSAKDFEDAVAWIIWALGFSPISFGNNAKTRDAADIIAVSPKGDFIIVECTLGLLKSDQKLSKLGARAVALKAALTRSNFATLRVLPVIITAMSLDEVQADISSAEEAGVYIVTKEDIEEIQKRILIAQDANQLFEDIFADTEMKKAARAKSRRVEAQ